MKKCISDKLRKQFDFGNGVSIVIGDLDGKTGRERVRYVYTYKKTPPFNYKTLNRENIVDVEISSSAMDDQKLLHLLFDRTRSKKADIYTV